MTDSSFSYTSGKIALFCNVVSLNACWWILSCCPLTNSSRDLSYFGIVHWFLFSSFLFPNLLRLPYSISLISLQGILVWLMKAKAFLIIFFFNLYKIYLFFRCLCCTREMFRNLFFSELINLFVYSWLLCDIFSYWVLWQVALKGHMLNLCQVS